MDNENKDLGIIEEPIKKGPGRPKGRTDSKPRKKYKKRKSNKLSRKKVSKIVFDHLAGKPGKDIAAINNVSESAISQILKDFEPIFQELKYIDKYRDVKSQLLSAGELNMLKKLHDVDKIDSASLNQIAYTFDKLNTANRLEQNLSTSNVQTFTKIKIVDD